MADVATECPLVAVAKQRVKQVEPDHVDGILKKAGQEKLIVPGNWTPVSSHDSHIQDLGKFAVDEHNKTAIAQLEFVTVGDGLHKRVRNLILYMLYLTAEDEMGNRALYKAVVKESCDCWPKKKELLSFQKEA